MTKSQNVHWALTVDLDNTGDRESTSCVVETTTLPIPAFTFYILLATHMPRDFGTRLRGTDMNIGVQEFRRALPTDSNLFDFRFNINFFAKFQLLL